MTPDLLRKIGQTLHGDRWQSPLARDLGVNDRTLRRWVAGEWPIPDRITTELSALLDKRAAQATNLANQLRRPCSDSSTQE